MNIELNDLTDAVTYGYGVGHAVGFSTREWPAERILAEMHEVIVGLNKSAPKLDDALRLVALSTIYVMKLQAKNE